MTAALLLCLVQLTIETIAIAVRVGGHLLGPYAFTGTQMYDFCVKLFLMLPGGAAWSEGGALDRFLGAGFAPKLLILNGLVVPNLIVGAGLALLIGTWRYWRGRNADVGGCLLAFGLVALVVHLVAWAMATHVPNSWTFGVLLRNAARVLVWEGAYVGFLVFSLAMGIAIFLCRLRAPVRLATLAAAGALLGVAVLVTPNSTTASLGVENEAPGAVASSLDPIDNVILISIDSLRADRLGSYGNEHDTSPTLDRLARDGIRFTDAMSTTSWTLPSHVSMLTGRYLLSHGVITRNDRIPDGIPMLAESLQRAGIATGGVVSAPMLVSKYGFPRGFDEYDESTVPSKSWDDALVAEPAPRGTELAMKWLRARAGERFFLFLHYWDVHYDYAPPPPYDTMFDPDYRGTINASNFYHNKDLHAGMAPRDLQHVFALYDGEIRWVDDHVAEVVALVGQLGLAQNTAIIVTADHGDEFFEHGFKGHTRTLYREVTQVPLIMRVPGAAAGRVVSTPVSLVDIAPTILELMGVGAPAGMNGVSLVAALRGGRLAEREAVHAWLCAQNQSANCQAMQYSGTGMLIHLFQPLRIEFYGPSDLWQQHDIAGTAEWPRNRQLASLEGYLNARWQQYRNVGGGKREVDIDKSTMERLRALGYAD